MTPNALVVGPDPARYQPVVQALRARDIPAWSDHINRVAFDFVSFDWADALVMFDTTAQIESRHLRAVSEFRGPALLCTPTPLCAAERVALLDGYYDVILPSSTSPLVIAAYVRRFVDRTLVDTEHRSRLFAVE